MPKMEKYQNPLDQSWKAHMSLVIIHPRYQYICLLREFLKMLIYFISLPSVSAHYISYTATMSSVQLSQNALKFWAPIFTAILSH